jgi:probable F420-dependent oxidoreductase
VKAGIMVPHVGQDTSAAVIRDVAQAAEELGYDSVWATDHVVFPVRYDSAYPFRPDKKMVWAMDVPYYELFSTLAFLSAATREIALGSATCIVPYRHPVLLAKTIATVDQLSAGRLICGVGVGWMEEEFQALGAEFRLRGEVTDESLALLRRAWQPDQPVTFHGTHFKVEECFFSPRCYGDRAMPLWVGGNSAAALRRTAAFGQAWFPHFYGSDPALLRRGWERIAALRAPGLRDTPAGVALFVPLRLAERPRPGLASPEPGWWLSKELSGSPDQVAAVFRQYQAAGVDHLVLSCAAGSPDERIAVMRRLREDVLPVVAAG